MHLIRIVNQIGELNSIESFYELEISFEFSFFSLMNCRAAIQFKLLTQNYDLPVVKPKRPSYEWYHPKGILKRNWILKHLHVLPAVIVLIQDLEWNDPLWTEKQYQCVSTMQTIKTSIQVRKQKHNEQFERSVESQIAICPFDFPGSTHKVGNCAVTKEHWHG